MQFQTGILQELSFLRPVLPQGIVMDFWLSTLLLQVCLFTHYFILALFDITNETRFYFLTNRIIDAFTLILADSTFKSSLKVSLARAWDAGVSSGEYVADSSPNGQLVIRNTEIDLVINVDAPYATSTSKRAYSGNTDTSRDLDNNTYNRFWEYDNTGDGA